MLCAGSPISPRSGSRSEESARSLQINAPKLRASVCLRLWGEPLLASSRARSRGFSTDFFQVTSSMARPTQTSPVLLLVSFLALSACATRTNVAEGPILGLDRSTWLSRIETSPGSRERDELSKALLLRIESVFKADVPGANDSERRRTRTILETNARWLALGRSCKDESKIRVWSVAEHDDPPNDPAAWTWNLRDPDHRLASTWSYVSSYRLAGYLPSPVELAFLDREAALKFGPTVREHRLCPERLYPAVFTIDYDVDFGDARVLVPWGFWKEENGSGAFSPENTERFRRLFRNVGHPFEDLYVRELIGRDPAPDRGKPSRRARDGSPMSSTGRGMWWEAICGRTVGPRHSQDPTAPRPEPLRNMRTSGCVWTNGLSAESTAVTSRPSRGFVPWTRLPPAAEGSL